MLHQKVKLYIANLLVLALGVGVAGMIAEGVLRILLEPVDYLQAQLVPDDILGHRVTPDGYDAWGFRNKAVPASVQVVAIGDSQTYSILTTAADSWPEQLEKLLGQDVYNLSLGGYGPAQYYHLLKDKGFRLKPSLVIVGLYLGNDILDAYNIVYAQSFWREWRNPGFFNEFSISMQTDRATVAERKKLLGGVRNWLAENSIFYRLSVFSFGNLFQFVEIKHSLASIDPDIAILETDEAKIQTAFKPNEVLQALDLRDARVKEGLRLTLRLFSEMRDLCSERNVAFLVVLIPTKETVFGKYITRNPSVKHFSTINELLHNEREINGIVKAYFQEHGIKYVDVLKELQLSLPGTNPYPRNLDGHLNPDGNGVVARVVWESLNKFGQRDGEQEKTF